MERLGINSRIDARLVNGVGWAPKVAKSSIQSPVLIGAGQITLSSVPSTSETSTVKSTQYQNSDLGAAPLTLK
jgi:hypothetical protein